MNTVIVNDINGENWTFFCNDKNNLCYRCGEGNENILQEGVRNSFDIVTDSDGLLHLVAQTDSGAMIYLIYDHSNWRKYIILNSRSSKNEMLKFKLFICDKKIHCFYILSYNGKSMLVHHTFNALERVDAPEVIAYVDGGKNFSCCCDTEGKIHIFFFDEESKFCYKIYSVNSGTYTDASIETEDNIKNISAICCDKGKVHTLYVSKIKSYYALIYYNFTEKERKIINFGDCVPTDICIFSKGDKICAVWRERSYFYKCESENGGVSFKKGVPINESKSRRTLLVKMRSAKNPKSLNCDYAVAIYDGKNFLQDSLEQRKYAPEEKTQNHKTSKNNYNIIDGEIFEQLRFMKSEILKNKKEITRLSEAVNSISEKLSFTDNQEKTDVSWTSDAENINEENYEIFKNTNIDDIKFEIIDKEIM